MEYYNISFSKDRTRTINGVEPVRVNNQYMYPSLPEGKKCRIPSYSEGIPDEIMGRYSLLTDLVVVRGPEGKYNDTGANKGKYDNWKEGIVIVRSRKYNATFGLVRSLRADEAQEFYERFNALAKSGETFSLRVFGGYYEPTSHNAYFVKQVTITD